MRRRVLLFNESGCLWGTLRSIFLTPRSAGFALSGGGAQHPKDSCESCQGQRSRFPLALVQTASRASQTECPFLSVSSAPADPLLGLASASFPGYLSACVVSHFSHVAWLCNPVDCSPPGASVHGILWAKILEWIAIPFSRGSSQLRGQTSMSHI